MLAEVVLTVVGADVLGVVVEADALVAAVVETAELDADEALDETVELVVVVLSVGATVVADAVRGWVPAEVGAVVGRLDVVAVAVDVKGVVVVGVVEVVVVVVVVRRVLTEGAAEVVVELGLGGIGN